MGYNAASSEESQAPVREDGLPWDDYERNLEYIEHFEPGAEATRREVEAILRLTGIGAGAELLDLCCGGGRHLVALADKGVQVTGVDLGRGFVEVARKRLAEAGLSGDVHISDVCFFVPKKRFDAITIMNNTFGFFDEDSNRLLLHKIYDMLRPGGSFVFDVGNREYTLKHLIPRQSWFELGGRTYLEQSFFDLERARWNSFSIEKSDQGDRRFVHSKRLYTRRELGELLLDTGFGELATYGDFELAAFALSSPKLITCARKAETAPAWERDLDAGAGDLVATPADRDKPAPGGYEPGHLWAVPRLRPFAGLPSRWFTVQERETVAGRFRLSFDRLHRCIVISALELGRAAVLKELAEVVRRVCDELAQGDVYERVVLEVLRCQQGLIELAEAAGLKALGEVFAGESALPDLDESELEEHSVELEGTQNPIAILMQRYF